MGLADSMKAKTVAAMVKKGTDMLIDDFDGNLPKFLDMVNKVSGFGDETTDHQRDLLNKFSHEYFMDPENNWRILIDKIRGLDRETIELFMNNFFVNSVVIGGNRQREVNAKENCNCPWAILMDPTTACNLHCNGC
jgi:hypothetical protein